MRFYDQVSGGWLLPVSKLRSRIKKYRRNYILCSARFIFLSAICIPNLAQAVFCANGVTPVIVGYHEYADYVSAPFLGITIQSTPQAGCAQWYVTSGHAARYAGSDFKLGMMTTGNESMLLVSRVIGNGVAEWYGTTEWTCDVVPLHYPDIQICSWSGPSACMGQILMRPVLQCSTPPPPPPPPPQPICQIRLAGFPAEVKPGDAASNLRADVTCDGVPTPKEVALTVRAEDYSGGHNHTSGRLNGALSPNSGSSPLNFSFVAPASAGDHTITAHCNDGSCGTDTGSVWVGIRNLQSLQADPSYVLIRSNSDQNHPANHYVTAIVQEKIQGLAQDYHGEFPNDPLLHLNDASLIRGGLFDLGANWSSQPRGHSTHRNGTDVDVRANEFYHNPNESVPSFNYVDFMRLATSHGCNAQIHSGATANEHFHLYCR